MKTAFAIFLTLLVGAACADPVVVAHTLVGDKRANILAIMTNGRTSCREGREAMMLRPNGSTEAGCWDLVGNMVRVHYDTGATFTYGADNFTIVDGPKKTARTPL